MSDEKFAGGAVYAGERHPGYQDGPAHDDGSTVRIAYPTRAMSLRGARDTGTEVMTTCGILALAALETLDVISRAAGKLAYQAMLDGSRAGFELTHEVGRTAHDVVVDVAATSVDTVVDLGSELIRGAHLVAKQSRELGVVIADLGNGLASAALTLVRRPRTPEPTRAAAVPIIVN